VDDLEGEIGKMSEDITDEPAQPAGWQPLTAMQRRVLGVLVEKAKTTPDAYPLTVNALTNGCNQKSNRSPKMELEAYEVEECLVQLRNLNVVVEIWDSGRVPKYRHDAYDWLGVDKQEMAVIIELLLRGEQTVGELRGRAARMEPIADMSELRPILASLQEKGLLLPLTPAGRGQVITHALYQEEERNKLLNQFENATPDQSQLPTEKPPRQIVPISAAPVAPEVTLDMYSELQVELAEVQAEVSRLRLRLEKLESLVQGESGNDI